jgi:protoporphyrinogen oxidase
MTPTDTAPRQDGDPLDCIVVGAGLAGLATASMLHRAGRRVLVLEASDDIGGRVRTDHVDGFTLDRGFQVMLTAYPEAHRQLDLDGLRLRSFEPGALVMLDGKAHVVGDPFRRPRTMTTTALAPIGSPLDKARLLRQRYRVQREHPVRLLGGDDTSTIGALRAEGFSPRMIDRFFRPLFGGIQLDPTLTTSRRMFDVILRMLLDGESAVPATGMGAIPRQLAGSLPPGTVRCGQRVTAVTPRSVATNEGALWRARTVVVAAEGPVASELLSLPPVGSRSVGCVYFAAARAPVDHRLVILNGSGEGPALNVAVMSNVAPEYAPAGQHLIAAATPGDIGDDLEGRVRAQLRSWWGTPVDGWRHLRTYRIAHGQPDQSPPFNPRQRVALTDGLFVTGDHRDTGSIQGALYSGRRCAAAVIAATT